MKGRDEVEHKNDEMPCNVYLIVYKVYKKKYFPLMKFDCGTYKICSTKIASWPGCSEIAKWLGFTTNCRWEAWKVLLHSVLLERANYTLKSLKFWLFLHFWFQKKAFSCKFFKFLFLSKKWKIFQVRLRHKINHTMSKVLSCQIYWRTKLSGKYLGSPVIAHSTEYLSRRSSSSQVLHI